MKLNLPSTWTSEKITSLIFLTWLSSNQVNAGQAFKNWLTYNTDTTSYDLLLKYPFLNQPNITSGGILYICCSSYGCSSISSNCLSKEFGCNKIAQAIFCGQPEASAYVQGIVGDTIITNKITIGNCLSANSIDTISSYIANLPSTSFIGTDNGYASWLCSSNPNACQKNFYGCSWDNGGWTCAGYLVDGGGNVLSCFVQWPAPWPGPADKNPLSLSATTAVSSSSSISFVSATTSTTSGFASVVTQTLLVTPTSDSSNNSHLAEKIAIPIGTTVGIGSASGLVYYFWRRKKNRKILEQIPERENNQEAVELETFEAEQSAHEIYLTQNWGQSQNQQQTQQTQVGRSQQQAQIEVNPYLAFRD